MNNLVTREIALMFLKFSRFFFSFPFWSLFVVFEPPGQGNKF